MDRWTWVLRYGVACFFALLLAALLDGTRLFHDATLRADGPTAADVVRFLGDGAALLLVWFAAARAAATLRDDGSWRSFLRPTLTPLATLVVLAVGYGVPLFVLHPFLNPPVMMVYRWLFVLAIIGAALWLAWAGYQNAEALGAIVARLARQVSRHRAIALPAAPAAPQRCGECGTTISPGAVSCQHCGHKLAA
jgi:hypothetical protein